MVENPWMPNVVPINYNYSQESIESDFWVKDYTNNEYTDICFLGQNTAEALNSQLNGDPTLHIIKTGINWDISPAYTSRIH